MDKPDRPANAGKPWNDDLDYDLIVHIEKDTPIDTIAAEFQRTSSAIMARLTKFALDEMDTGASIESVCKQFHVTAENVELAKTQRDKRKKDSKARFDAKMDKKQLVQSSPAPIKAPRTKAAKKVAAVAPPADRVKLSPTLLTLLTKSGANSAPRPAATHVITSMDTGVRPAARPDTSPVGTSSARPDPRLDVRQDTRPNVSPIANPNVRMDANPDTRVGSHSTVRPPFGTALNVKLNFFTEVAPGVFAHFGISRIRTVRQSWLGVVQTFGLRCIGAYYTGTDKPVTIITEPCEVDVHMVDRNIQALVPTKLATSTPQK